MSSGALSPDRHRLLHPWCTLALAAYSFVRSSNYAISVHVTALILMLGSFLLIRLSRQAYRRSLLDLRDSSDTTFDAVISSLIASALIWQGGLVEDYSRGIALLFLLAVVVTLSLSRPLLHRLITRLAERGRSNSVSPSTARTPPR